MTDFLQTILHVFSFHRGPGALEGCCPPLAKPSRDWSILMAVFAALLLCLLALDAWMYFSVSMLGGARTQKSGASFSLDTRTMQEVLAAYQASDAEHASLLSAAPKAADPAK